MVKRQIMEEEGSMVRRRLARFFRLDKLGLKNHQSLM
jgi:hypothetical protein